MMVSNLIKTSSKYSAAIPVIKTHFRNYTEKGIIFLLGGDLKLTASAEQVDAKKWIMRGTETS